MEEILQGLPVVPIAAALKYCRAQSEPKNVVTFVCDGDIFQLYKIMDAGYGFLAPPKTGDLEI